jgi:hypothetical protein
LLEFLESSYPPKCLEPDQSRDLAVDYGGRVRLIGEMRQAFDIQQAQDVQ